MPVCDLAVHQSILCRIIVIGSLFAVIHFCIISGDHLPTVEIASKSTFTSSCVDPDGNTRIHLEEWTESSGSCDRRICYSQAAETLSFTLKYDCPPQLDEIDAPYCSYVSGSALTFPGCCPELQCTNGTLPNTTNPECYDKSPSFSCEFWRNLTGCVDNTTSIHLSFLYNLTVENCRETCGYCNTTS